MARLPRPGLRRRRAGYERAPFGARLAGVAGTRRMARRQRQGCARGIRRGVRNGVPCWPAGHAEPLQHRLPLDRDTRDLRAAAACAHLLGSTRSSGSARWPRRRPGSWLEIHVRHHVQTAARRQGCRERALRRAHGRTRVHQQSRSTRNGTRVRRHAIHSPNAERALAGLGERYAFAIRCSSTTPPATAPRDHRRRPSH